MTDMNEEYDRLWTSFQAGDLTAMEAGQRILQVATQSQGSTNPDRDRQRRCGYPEVIYGSGKSPFAIQQVAEVLLQDNREILVTRVSPEQVRPLSEDFPFSRWNHVGRTFRIGRNTQPLDPDLIPGSEPTELSGQCVAVVSAGTTDEPVAIEARETLAWMGLPSVLIQDIGVAGPYRLLAKVSLLQQMAAIVCVAGMEGALPSVLAGHVPCPVFAVPTSVGYGANFAGLSALLCMINSCAANVAVVNIDAGFKAGYLAGLVAKKSHDLNWTKH